LAVAVLASVVSLSIFRHADAAGVGHRKIWLVFAGASGAFGIFAAHVIATLAHNAPIAEFNTLVMNPRLSSPRR
jgi:NO-binding membrane sensor protein with MHYT domain